MVTDSQSRTVYRSVLPRLSENERLDVESRHSGELLDEIEELHVDLVERVVLLDTVSRILRLCAATILDGSIMWSNHTTFL